MRSSEPGVNQTTRLHHDLHNADKQLRLRPDTRRSGLSSLESEHNFTHCPPCIPIRVRRDIDEQSPHEIGAPDRLPRTPPTHHIPVFSGAAPTIQVLVVPVHEPDWEHIFKVCPEWKAQQKILWAQVWKETGRWKDQLKIRDLLADERCSRSVLDFFSSTEVGRWEPSERGHSEWGVGGGAAGVRGRSGGRGAGRIGGITTIPAQA